MFGRFRQRDGVGNDNLVDFRRGNTADCLSREYGMAGICQDTFCSALFQSDSSFTQRIRGINHVVHNQASTALNVADDVHDFRHIGFRAAFVDNRQIGI